MSLKFPHTFAIVKDNKLDGYGVRFTEGDCAIRYLGPNQPIITSKADYFNFFNLKKSNSDTIESIIFEDEKCNKCKIQLTPENLHQCKFPGYYKSYCIDCKNNCDSCMQNKEYRKRKTTKTKTI